MEKGASLKKITNQTAQHNDRMDSTPGKAAGPASVTRKDYVRYCIAYAWNE